MNDAFGNYLRSMEDVTRNPPMGILFGHGDHASRISPMAFTPRERMPRRIHAAFTHRFPNLLIPMALRRPEPALSFPTSAAG